MKRQGSVNHISMDGENNNNESCYPLRDIYEIDLLFKIYKSTPGGEKDIKKLTDLHDRFHRYDIPTIEVVGGTWDDTRKIQAFS